MWKREGKVSAYLVRMAELADKRHGPSGGMGTAERVQHCPSVVLCPGSVLRAGERHVEGRGEDVKQASAGRREIYLAAAPLCCTSHFRLPLNLFWGCTNTVKWRNHFPKRKLCVFLSAFLS